MIVGISGKKHHGKDLLAMIIQGLITQVSDTRSGKDFPFDVKENLDWYIDQSQRYRDTTSGWTKKMFAGKVKEIVCLLIGCTMKELEDQTFKEKELGEDWFYWEGTGFRDERYIYGTFEEAYEAKKAELIYKYSGPYQHSPRTLLQLVGTEAGRKLIHPNLWINATFVDYKPRIQTLPSRRGEDGLWYAPGEDGWIQVSDNRYCKEEYPNWIITDVRFPNEVEAIKKRGGIVIRLDRPSVGYTGNHESETALDDYADWSAFITNHDADGIGALVSRVKVILENYKIL